MLLAFGCRRDQMRAAVELVDDLENGLLQLVGRCVRGHQHADSQMRLGPQFSAGLANTPLPAHGRGETCKNALSGKSGRLGRLPRAVHAVSSLDILVDHAQHRKVGAVAEARKLLQRFLRPGGQAIQLLHHEVDDVVGIAFGVDAIEVPRPSAPSA